MTMKVPFERDYNISYFEVDNTMTIKPHRLVGILQDLAVTHSDLAGYDLQWFNEHERAWIITGWHVVINRRPMEGENLKLKSWTRKYRRIQSDRSFEVFDEEGNVVFVAESRWFLMNTTKRKPARVPDEFIHIYGDIESADEKYQKSIIEDETFEAVELCEEDFVAERKFVVTRRDTDTNNHTNNIAYIEWAMDDIPDEIYLKKKLKDIRVNYVLECVKGEEIRSRYYEADLGDGRWQVTSVFDNEEGKVNCQVTTIWE